MRKKDVLIIRRKLRHCFEAPGVGSDERRRTAESLAGLAPDARSRVVAALRHPHNERLVNPSNQVPDLLGALARPLEVSDDPGVDELDGAGATVVEGAALVDSQVRAVLADATVDPRLRRVLSSAESPSIVTRHLGAVAARRAADGSCVGPEDLAASVEGILCRHAVVVAAARLAQRAEERRGARPAAVALGWRDAAAVVSNPFVAVEPRRRTPPGGCPSDGLHAAARVEAGRVGVRDDALLGAVVALAIVVHRRRRDSALRRRAEVDRYEVVASSVVAGDVIDLCDSTPSHRVGSPPPARHEAIAALRQRAASTRGDERAVLETIAYVHEVSTHGREWFAAAYPPDGNPGQLDLLWSASLAVAPEIAESPPGRSSPTAARRQRISRLAGALAAGPKR